MEKIYVILKPIIGSDSRSIKLFCIQNDVPVIILDDYIEKKKEVDTYSTDNINSYIRRILGISNSDIELIHL